MNDKQFKAEFRKEASNKYTEYYPVKSLQELGYVRSQCTNCKKYFWSTTKTAVCGEAECEGGYSFIGKARNPMSFVEVWEKFSQIMKKQGYTPIKRYPCIARWNETMHFTIASIADFQPYVVSGAVEPPANPLTVPQICLRFVDLDNVGITGRHNTGFTMIGQHAFLPKSEWDQNKIFLDYYKWYSEGMLLKPDELKIHEDVWAGGGNFGPCMEFFSGGLEIGNQVYMMYERTGDGLSDRQELPIKVLDMGMGQERPAWFSQGTPTVYDAVFPEAIKYLVKEIGYKPEGKILQSFIPYSGILNIDEAEDINKSWEHISEQTKIPLKELKTEVNKAAGFYSILDHSRALLYALADGAIPSNVGGNYNLRILYRRLRNFMDQYDWKFDMHKLFEIHAMALEKEYPELKQNLNNVNKIIDVEEIKYLENKTRNAVLLQKIIQKPISKNDLLKYYDSYGLSPNEIKDAASKIGKEVDIPDNFYVLISELHEGKETKTSTKKSLPKLNLAIMPTNILYYETHNLLNFQAKIAYVDNNIIVLDRTAFYPTSGGQLHDIGTINSEEVINVYKEGKHIIHELKNPTALKVGMDVKGSINPTRRLQLAQHHTVTHVLLGASSRILGSHVWQSGAAKTEEKGRLDITHYEIPSNEEIEKIESLVIEIIKENRPIIKQFYSRTDAEQTFGFKIYQGGAVPGNQIRIIQIQDFDVQACGGTHLSTTGEIIDFKIIKVSKLQDGVIRLEYVAGEKARQNKLENKLIINELITLLNCKESQIPARSKELFDLWKNNRKTKESIKIILQSNKESEGDLLEETATLLKTQKEHIIKTIKRFIFDLTNK